jgi:hypothetical protein
MTVSLPGASLRRKIPASALTGITTNLTNAMPATSPYIPNRDADFADWSANFSTLISAAPATYGLVAADATTIAASNTSWQAAYTLAVNPVTRTPATVAAKDAARASAEAVFRPYAIRIRDNASVTDANKVALGLTIPSLVPTPIPPPTVAPVLALVSATPLVTKLGYKATGSAGKAKPYGSIGVEIWTSIGTAAATDPVQCTYRCTATKSPFLLNHSAENIGKILTVFARFSNRSGTAGIADVGPWSASLVTTII